MTTETLTLLDEMIEAHRRLREYIGEVQGENPVSASISAIGRVSPGITVAETPAKRGRGRPRKTPIDPQLEATQP